MFYVYTLSDPRDGAVFYVGKGCRSRLEQHERQAARGAVNAKCDRIRAIWADGGEVIRSRVASYAKEIDALREEARLIAEIGLSHLTNVAPGGRGGRHKRAPMAWTPRLIRQVAPGLRRSLREMTAGDGRLYMGEVEITNHVLSVVAMLRREAGDDMLREHAGVTFA